MKEENKDCLHIYEKAVKNVAKRHKEYLGDGKYDICTLQQEEHYLFCNKCGDIKNVDLSSNK